MIDARIGNEQIAGREGVTVVTMLEVARAGNNNTGLEIGMPVNTISSDGIEGNTPYPAVANVMNRLARHMQNLADWPNSSIY